MWGEFVHRAGVGPKPTPVTQLTTKILVGKLRDLTSEPTKQKAVSLAGQMNAEDGVSCALEHFWSALPRDNMMCSVGLIMGKSLLAKYRFRDTDIPISQEVASVSASSSSGSFRLLKQPSVVRHLVDKVDPRREKLVPMGTTTYALRHRGGYDSFFRGVMTSILELFEWSFRTILQFFKVPDRYARKHGLLGCIVGFLVWPLYTAYCVYRTIIVFLDRIGVTIANGIFGKQWLYLIDKDSFASPCARVQQDDSAFSNAGNEVSLESIAYIKAAEQIARDAMDIFRQCRPGFPKDHWHWKEVRTEILVSKVVENDGKSKLGLSDEEFDVLAGRLHWANTRMQRLSYSRFCLFVGEAVHGRFYRGNLPPSTKCSVHDAVKCYLT